MTAPVHIFIDSNVAVLAVGGEHPLKEPCRTLFSAAAGAELILHASIELIQEFTYHRQRRRDPRSAASEGRLLRDTLTLHPFDGAVADRMLDLTASGSVRGKDAVHAATALEAGFDAIVTADNGFDGIPGLRRIDPSALAAELARRDS